MLSHIGGKGLGVPVLRVSVVRTTTAKPPGMGLWRPVKQVPPDPDLQAEFYG
jgi:hypothetical protein